MTTEPTAQTPHNLDAERAALGCVFVKSTAWSELKGSLVTDDFFLPAHREVFDAMAAVAKRDRPPSDVIAVVDELRARGMLSRLPDGEAFVLTLTGAVGHAENLGHYLGIVREKAALRRIIANCAEAASRATGDAESTEILADLRRAIGAVELSGRASGTVRIGDVQEGAAESLEGRFEEPSRYVVSTGLRSLDSVLGGFKPGQQIVIASNPGQGKTSLTWTMLIRAALNRVPCLLFSLEMGLQEMVERAWTLVGEVPGLGFQRPEKPQWNQIRCAMQALSDKPLYINDQKLSLPRLTAEATAWRAKHPDGLALIAVDYLGLVNAKAQGRNREQEVATVSTECKRLAGDLGVPLILVAQLNRENVKGNAGERRRPVMSDLRDSGAVEQDADVIVFPWKNPEDNVMRLIVEKHRNGKTGAVRVDFKRELMGFFDMPYEQDWHDVERGDS